MKLALVISSLGPGGAERILVILANSWASRGYDVSLFTFDDGTAVPAYDLDKAIDHRPLDLARDSANPLFGALNNLWRIARLNRELRHAAPTAVVSFIDRTNVLVLLASFGVDAPVVVSERVDPTRYDIGWAWRLLRRWSYRRAASIVVQTASALQHLPKRLRKRAVVIPNPVVVPSPDRAPGSRAQDGRGKMVLAMGRLVRQKGFDLLVRAFSRISSRHSDWSLVIWGDGEERHGLEAMRDELGLANRVSLPGTTRRPYDEMRRADLFVLSSRFEGFPNALCEAMACGMAVIASDCPSGPRDIIADDINGVLVAVDDTDALSRAMDRLMSDDGVRERLGSRAIEVSERFSLENSIAAWDNLLESLTAKHRNASAAQ